jgi:hypothetical protein
MKRRQIILFVVALLLMGSVAIVLARFQHLYRLGRPGVKTSEITNSVRLRVELPEQVPGYESRWLDPVEGELGALPPDTSFGKRIYRNSDGFEALLTVVLMGTDRTSLHKPQFCLEGQGCHIDNTGTLETTIHLERPCAYDLPVVRLVTSVEKADPSRSRAVYVYWYVADGELSASVSGGERQWWMARDLILNGVLQRWAYVSCFAQCAPGEEEATFQRMKQLIAATVPEFQLTPSGPLADNQHAGPQPGANGRVH